jgi:hypothetical protein
MVRVTLNHSHVLVPVDTDDPVISVTLIENLQDCLRFHDGDNITLNLDSFPDLTLIVSYILTNKFDTQWNSVTVHCHDLNQQSNVRMLWSNNKCNELVTILNFETNVVRSPVFDYASNHSMAIYMVDGVLVATGPHHGIIEKDHIGTEDAKHKAYAIGLNRVATTIFIYLMTMYEHTRIRLTGCNISPQMFSFLFAHYESVDINGSGGGYLNKTACESLRRSSVLHSLFLQNVDFESHDNLMYSVLNSKLKRLAIRHESHYESLDYLEYFFPRLYRHLDFFLLECTMEHGSIGNYGQWYAIMTEMEHVHKTSGLKPNMIIYPFLFVDPTTKWSHIPPILKEEFLVRYRQLGYNLLEATRKRYDLPEGSNPFDSFTGFYDFAVDSV